MTKKDWLVATEPDELLALLSPRTSSRKMRLVRCACFRGFWGKRYPDQILQSAVEVAEQYADGLIGHDRFTARWRKWDYYHYAWGHFTRELWPVAEPEPETTTTALALLRAYKVHPGDEVSEAQRKVQVEKLAQSKWMRDIFPNPANPLVFDPAWRTSTAVSLAEAIYADRAFDRLPILADALQDAGCEDADVLGHCHGDGPHVRGCWVVDLVLGKE